MTDFGGLIRSMRQAKGYTIQEVADRVGTKKGYISGVERNKVNPPSPEVVKKLARVLGIDKIELLLLAYIQKAPVEIKGILEEGAQAAMAIRKKKEPVVVAGNPA